MTDEEYQRWIENPNNTGERVLLFLIYKVGYTIKLSNMPFYDGINHYDDLITKLPSFEQSIEGFSIGSLKAIDALNEWGDLSFRGAGWTAMYGGLNWGLADFREIASGLIDNATRKGNEYAFDLVGHNLILNNEMATEENPVFSFGTAHNVEAILLDGANLVYRVHSSGCDYIEVYDRGVKITEFTDNNDGTFKLHNSPAGLITALVSNHSVNTVKKTIDYIADLAGYPSPEYRGISNSQLNYYIGTAFYAGITYLEAMQFIAGSIGAFVVIGQLNKITIIGTSSLVVAGTISDDDVIASSASQSGAMNAVDSLSLTYSPNNRVMTNEEVAGAAFNYIDQFTRKHLVINDGNISSRNGAFSETEVINTALRVESQAQNIFNAANSKRRRERKIYRVKVHDSVRHYRVGDYVITECTEIPFDNGTVTRVKHFADNLLTEIDILES